jgi:uncharacterized protein YjbJ (UPF0337 family)
MTMSWSTIENGWKNYKAAAKQQWSKLSDEQLEDTKGQRDYSVSREDAERQITDWQGKQTPAPAAKN